MQYEPVLGKFGKTVNGYLSQSLFFKASGIGVSVMYGHRLNPQSNMKTPGFPLRKSARNSYIKYSAMVAKVHIVCKLPNSL